MRLSPDLRAPCEKGRKECLAYGQTIRIFQAFRLTRSGRRHTSMRRSGFGHKRRELALELSEELGV